METRRPTDTSQKRLFRALASRCHGRTAVVELGDDDLAAGLERLGVRAVAIDPRRNGHDGSFRTVLVVRALERCSDEEGSELLAAAWRLVNEGGRLIVTAPNKGCKAALPGEREFDARSLRRLLAPLGKARLWTDQPFKWLALYVDKPGVGRPHESRSRRDRYQVTARLCRGKVLELGCGEGHLAQAISHRGLEVTGVEINAPKVRRARELYPHIAFLEGDILRVSLPEEHFDTVVIAEVLEHVDESVGDAMLTRAWRCLKRGGRLIVSVPNEDCIPHRNHVRQFDRCELKRLLSPLGPPRLVSDQPYKWLMMLVHKKPDGVAPAAAGLQGGGS